MSKTRGGKCLCGSVRFKASGAPEWVAHCHCNSCRKFTGAVFATYAGYELDKISFGGAPPVQHHSSPEVTRSFCGKCGSAISYASACWPGESHLLVCAFDAPGAFVPQAHVYWAQHVPWLGVTDDLPKYEKFSTDQ